MADGAVKFVTNSIEAGNSAAPPVISGVQVDVLLEAKVLMVSGLLGDSRQQRNDHQRLLIHLATSPESQAIEVR